MNKMIRVTSDKLIYVFFFVALMYMSYIAANMRDLFVMLFISFAMPAIGMSVHALYKKWEERKRHANYYVGKR